MEVRDRVKGIHGVVADIISTKKEYETAIETALGGSIQNIVTDSETTAKQLIDQELCRLHRCHPRTLGEEVGIRCPLEIIQSVSEYY